MASISNAGYLGDYAAGSTVTFMVTSAAGDGTPTTISFAFSAVVYKNGSASAGTAIATTSKDIDALSGLNGVTIDTSASVFFTAGDDYQVVVDGATVSGVALEGTVIASFSIENRSTDTLKTLIQSK